MNSHQSSENELHRILDYLSNRREPCSKLLDEALPILRERIDENNLLWLAQEKEGYGVLEGTRQGLAPTMREYRNVFFHRMEMIADGIHTGTPIEPTNNQPRLNFLGFSLRDIEGLINSPENEFGIPHPDVGFVDNGVQIQALTIFDKNQLHRVLESFRFHFAGLLINTLGLESED